MAYAKHINELQQFNTGLEQCETEGARQVFLRAMSQSALELVNVLYSDECKATENHSENSKKTETLNQVDRDVDMLDKQDTQAMLDHIYSIAHPLTEAEHTMIAESYKANLKRSKRMTFFVPSPRYQYIRRAVPYPFTMSKSRTDIMTLHLRYEFDGCLSSFSVEISKFETLYEACEHVINKYVKFVEKHNL